ncbi:MAG: hypothetical protein EZS28_045950 [Streblomastix strix]|uniref:Protein kinase domain-containing protein n=1 Tax=Streblomastix strix TaxID=222440 RepID=A0A5J4TL99_9EUKA|nr:MAG: hypothetical protein EZS28_045950 [Streblomastix strix]
MESCVFQVFKPELGIVAAKVIKKYDFGSKKWRIGFQLTQENQNPFVLKYISANIYGDKAVIIMEVLTVLLRQRKIFPCQSSEQSWCNCV